jgi:hypothetical protein
MQHTEIRRAINNLINGRHTFILIEGILRYECFVRGFPELVTMAGNKSRGNLGCMLVVRLGRRLLKNNYFGVQEGLACVGTVEDIAYAYESVSAQGVQYLSCSLS